MRIREVEIQNFRSLQRVKLDALGDFVILIGRNGSGKSNILEALEIFFADLNLVSDVEKQAVPELWFDKRTNVPIDIRVVVELEKHEGRDDFDQIFSKEVLASLKLEAPPDGGRRLTIRRQITGNIWKNVEVRLENVFSLEDGKIVFKRPQPEMITPPPNDSPVVASQISQEGPLDPEASQALLTNITAKLKNGFRLIRGPRESNERLPAPARPAVLDSESKTFFRTLALEKDRSKEAQWSQYVEEFEYFSGRRMQIRGTEIELKQQDLVLPLELSGSGDQALLILIRQFHQSGVFLGIEEPETRLHHDYVRKLFQHLRKLSRDSQIIIATHSPVFVDKAFLRDTWLTRIEGKRTVITRVEEDELATVLLELGIRPSDFFFANQLLFVEGRSEQVFLPLLLAKAGLDFSNVNMLPTKGKTTTRYHLRVWLEAASHTGIPAYVLLDKNGRAEVEEALNARLIERENYMVLDKESLREKPHCDIEDFYPKDLLKQWLAEFHKDRINLEELVLNDAEPVAPMITSALNTESWKVPLATYIGERLTSEHVENELREIVRFLRRIPETRSVSPSEIQGQRPRGKFAAILEVVKRR